MGESVAGVILAMLIAGIAYILWIHISERREKRKRAKAHGAQLGDPSLCNHDWEVVDSGVCMPDYSSFGPDPQETWTAERCPYCGEERFQCPGSIDCGKDCHMASNSD